MAALWRACAQLATTSVVNSFQNRLLLAATCTSSIIVNHVQVREMSGYRYMKKKLRDPSYWVKRRQAFKDQHLTPSNYEFLKEVAAERDAATETKSPLKESPFPRGEWAPRSLRTGLIARKIGIYPMWSNTGERFLTTLLQVVDNHVIHYTPPKKFANNVVGRRYKGRYGCLIVGADRGDPQKFTKAYSGLFDEAGVTPKNKLTRFLVTENAAIQPGTPLYATHFRVSDYVDVYGISINHGFQGVVKRWGMKGGPASHGTTKWHRRGGTIGTGRQMARVWPGKKMPGQMGARRRYHRGLKIWRINTKHNVIWVHGGAVPGGVNSYVYIVDSILPTRKPSTPPPFPTHYPDEEAQPLPEELHDPELHMFADPTLTFDDQPEIVLEAVAGKKGAKVKSKR